MNEVHVDQKRYGCKIILHKAKNESANRELLRYWNGFRFRTYMKWRWYFRYLVAKYQVQHPTYYVEWVEFGYDYVEPKEEARKRITNKIRSAKAKITQWTGKIEQFLEEYEKQQAKVLFPVPVSENKDYKATLKKLEQKKKDLATLEEQLTKL